MQFLLIAFETSEDFRQRADPVAFKAYLSSWRLYAEELSKAGVLRDGLAVDAPDTATCLSLKNGAPVVQDGPFADAKEQIGGFIVIDVADKKAAIKWAADCPAARNGRVEVRSIPDYSGA